MKEIRCPKCNQLLLKATVCIGEIKCIRCKEIVRISMKSDRVSNTTKSSK